MTKIKEVLTTIEDDVVFMVDPEAQFVSLVKYGANRAPFKVLKNHKEVSDMKKVVQSVLVKNDLPEDVIVKALEGIDRREGKHYESFDAYPQVPLSKVEKDSLAVVKHEEVEGIFFVLGDLSKETTDQGTLQIDVKEAVDYATMDNLYTELYAMADIVGGAMRQENAEGDFRKDTILKAIDNFRTFAEVVLEKISEKEEKAINPADHPTLVFPLVKKEEEKKEETDEEKKAREEAEKKKVDIKDLLALAEEEAKKKAEEDAAAAEKDPNFDVFVNTFNESLATFGEKLVEAISTIGKDVANTSKAVTEAVEKVSSEVEEFKNTVVASKTELEEVDNATADKKDIWKGSIISIK